MRLLRKSLRAAVSRSGGKPRNSAITAASSASGNDVGVTLDADKLGNRPITLAVTVACKCLAVSARTERVPHRPGSDSDGRNTCDAGPAVRTRHGCLL